jgi:predicted nuclease with TOPRIM domain
VASGTFVDVVTSQLQAEKAELEAKVDRLLAGSNESMQNKLAMESKSQRLSDKVSRLEKEKDDLGHQLDDLKAAKVE